VEAVDLPGDLIALSCVGHLTLLEAIEKGLRQGGIISHAFEIGDELELSFNIVCADRYAPLNPRQTPRKCLPIHIGTRSGRNARRSCLKLLERAEYALPHVTRFEGIIAQIARPVESDGRSLFAMIGDHRISGAKDILPVWSQCLLLGHRNLLFV
jgi:hypothetical protein